MQLNDKIYDHIYKTCEGLINTLYEELPYFWMLKAAYPAWETLHLGKHEEDAEIQTKWSKWQLHTSRSNPWSFWKYK